jgi:hypothetical protein
MTRTIKELLFVLLLTILGCTGMSAQTTVNAASCNESDVNAVINGPTHTAVSGDTINIPAGSCTWTTQMTVSVDITIQGAGQGVTTIVDNLAGTPFFVAKPSGSTLFRMTAMTLQGGSALSGTDTEYAMSFTGPTTGAFTQFRLDHLTFTGFGGTSTINVIFMDNIFGVLDHITDTQNNEVFVTMNESAYQGVGSNGDNSWAQPDSLGTANAVYIENSSFTGTGAAGMAATDCDQGGCRFVFRFNTLVQAGVFNHGTESAGRPRGGRQMEVYDNTFTSNEALDNTLAFAVQVRSGTALIWNNTVNYINYGNYPAFTNFISLLSQRANFSFAPWGTCDGLGPYDDNDGTTYASGTYTGSSGGTTLVDSSKSWTTNQWVNSGAPYSIVDTTQGWGSEITANTSNTITYPAGGEYSQPNTWNAGDSYKILRATVCIDQPGRGQGTLLSASFSDPLPTGWVTDALDPVYALNNNLTNAGLSYGEVVASSARTIANRDYYIENSSFNGASGTGSGTLASRPSTCTVAVAYLATDQGSWNQSGSGGQGEIFVCTATNTWTLYYTPYTYPHPLDTTGTALAPPTNVQAVGH